MESKLYVTTRIDWAKEVKRKELEDFPTYAQLKTFLEDRIRTLDLVQAETYSAKTSAEKPRVGNKLLQNSHERRPFSPKAHRAASAHVATRKGSKSSFKPKCSFCEGEHFVGHCPQFSSCPQEQSREHVLKSRLCVNCFSSQRNAEACTSAGRCLACGEKHHTKLQKYFTVSKLTFKCGSV